MRLGILTIVLLPFFCFTALAALGDGSCTGYNSTCGGATLDSSFGYGAVELCGDCYRCGEADGVCPEDFSNGTDSVDCSFCPDPDCQVNLSGKVYPVWDDTLGINDVTVTAQAVYINDWETRYSTLTREIAGVPGSYWMSVPRGNYKVSAQKFGYDTHLETFPLHQGANETNYTLNISLANGSCNADCTGYNYGNSAPTCRPECHGFNNSNGESCFYNMGAVSPISGNIYNVSLVCANQELGTVSILDANQTHSYAVSCCDNAPYLTSRPKIEVQETDIRDLIQQTIVARLQGEASLVKVKILVYNS